MDDLFLRGLFQSDRQARSKSRFIQEIIEFLEVALSLMIAGNGYCILVEWNLYVYDLVYDIIGGRLSSDFFYLYLCTLTVLYFIMY